MNTITVEGKQFSYYAFISYNHKDKGEAKWLQSKLEKFSLPTDLHEQTGVKHLRPIFRDETDLASGELSVVLQEELRRSRYLIVICSPNSAKSQWVNEEILYFEKIHGRKFIIPFIIAGSPNTMDEKLECYPRAFKSYGDVLGISLLDISREAAVIKTVAQMLGVRYDILFDRQRRMEKRRNRIIGVISIFLSFCIGIGFTMYQKQAQTVNDIISVNTDSVAVEAFKKNDMNAFFAAIKNGANPNGVVDGQSLTYLCSAILKKDREVYSRLIDLGAKVSKIKINSIHGREECYTESPIVCAAIAGDGDLIEQLIKLGADSNEVGVSYMEPAIVSLCRKSSLDTKAIKLLLEHKANSNSVDLSGQSVLYSLCARRKSENTEVIKLLIDYKADVNLKDSIGGGTPLQAVCVTREINTELMKVLLGAGADPMCKDLMGRPLLHSLCDRRKGVNLAAIKLLLDYKANVNLKDISGRFPLETACSASEPNKELIEILLSYGADANASDESNQPLLHSFCARGKGAYVEIIKLLLDHKADVNLKDSSGEDPLHIVCRRSEVNLDAVKLLLDYGANVNSKNSEGQSVLWCTCMKTKPSMDLIELFVSRKADVNEKDMSGQSLLYNICAYRKPNLDIVKLLLKNNALSTKEIVDVCQGEEAKKLLNSSIYSGVNNGVK